MTQTHIEFRPETDAPKVPGFYWARVMRFTTKPELTIVEVQERYNQRRQQYGLWVAATGEEILHDMDRYQWFGPVTPARQSWSAYLMGKQA